MSKYRYLVFVRQPLPWRAPFNVQRQHCVDGKFYSSGHGKACHYIEQAMQWIATDKDTLNRNDTFEVCIEKV